jgi:hypothetical protein
LEVQPPATAGGSDIVFSCRVAGNEPHFSKFIDLNMLVMTGGRERTEEEFRKLYEGRRFPLSSHRADQITFQRD